MTAGMWSVECRLFCNGFVPQMPDDKPAASVMKGKIKGKKYLG